MMNSEQALRKTVRKGIKLYFQRRDEAIINSLLEESDLRLRLRQVVIESILSEENQVLVESEDTEVDTHDNTGINTLKDMLKNTNVLSTIRQVYKTLTTNENQRKSFRAHIIRWIQDTLAPIKINDAAPDPVEDQTLTEAEDPLADGDVDIVIDEDEKFIEADDGSPEEEPEPEESEESPMQPIDGEDTTGRNKAERIYPAIEKSIINYYGELDNDEDQELFHDYLIANMKLYFDKWENEMSPTPPEEPTNDAYDDAAGADEQEEF
jgi:hypothetical protein